MENINEIVKKYLQNDKKHAAYNKTCDIAYHLKFHFDGYCFDEGDKNPYFNKLIDQRRPGESAEVQIFRRKTYLGITKPTCSKVIVTLKKIVRSKDWNISFKDVKPYSKITESESLKTYLTTGLPKVKSLENWLLSKAIRTDIIDPNAVCAVLPENYITATNEYLKPYPFIFESENVLEFIENELLVAKTDKLTTYKGQNGQTYETPIFVIITKNEIFESYKIDGKGTYETKQVYTHNFNELPAFRLGGQYKMTVNKTDVYVSLVDAMLSGLDTAAREVSDLDEEVRRHIYSRMWYYAGQDCGECSGAGKVLQKGEQVICPQCKGEGVMKNTPFADIVIKKPGLEDKDITPPFGGYLEKNVEIVKVQDVRIQNHLLGALSAIFMDFLSPLAQSGIAKAYDKDEGNNFVYGCAEHFVAILDKVVYFIGEYRHSTVLPKKEARLELLPVISVPSTFDLLTANMIGERVTNAITNKHNPLIISELSRQYAEKEFGNESPVIDKLKATTELDPFLGMTVSEKNECYLSQTITKRDLYVSNYINQFIEMAFEEFPESSKEGSGFDDKNYSEKMAILYKYADEKIKSESAEKAVIVGANGV